jgi:hypothetical protein
MLLTNNLENKERDNELRKRLNNNKSNMELQKEIDSLKDIDINYNGNKIENTNENTDESFEEELGEKGEIENTFVPIIDQMYKGN